MKQTIRKVLSVVLALTIVLSIGIIAMGTNAAGSILFSDDFSATSSLTERGWHSDNPTVTDGALTIDNGRLTLSTVSGATAWTDYSVELDIRMIGVHEGTSSSDIVACIGVRTNAAGSTAYEFGTVFKRTNTSNTYVRLYQRGATTFTSNPTTNSKNPVTNTNVNFTYNETQHLRVDVLGDTITCYFNNDPTPVFVVTDSAFTAGTITLRAVNSVAVFDNIVVKDLSSAASSSTQQSSSQVVTSTPESSSSATSSAANEDIYFQDDFSAVNTSGRGWNKNWDTPNGNVAVANTNNYLTANSTYKAWTDYAVEADVSIDLNTNTASMNHATLVARATGGNTGYEFRLITANNGETTKAQLYDHSSTSSIASANNINWDYSKTHKMKMVVNGNDILCFVDGVLVMKTTSTSFSAGSIAIKGAGYTSTFDNIIVRKATTEEINAQFPQDTSSSQTSSAVSSETSSTTTSSTTSSSNSSATSSGSSDVYFSDDFSAANTSGRGWNKNWDTPNGNLPITNTNNFLTANSAYKAWTDYAVEVDVSIDLSTEPHSSMNHATLVARATGGNTGYEFRLITANNGETTKAQLYDYGTKTNIAAVSSIDWDYTKTHKMKMVVNGNDFLCFVDEILVMKATSTSYSAGSVALKGAGYTATFDNLVVRKATQAEINAQLPQDTSSTPSNQNSDVYFMDDFSASSTSGRGWNKTLSTPDGYLSFDNATTNNVYLTANNNYKAWTDYAVEVDIKIDGKAVVPNSKNNYAYLVFRTVSGTTGYYFRFMSATDGSKYVDLYDLAAAKSIASNKTYRLSYGITYRFKAVVQGDLILCFINDELVMKANATSAMAGSVGLRNEGNAARFDNLIVRKATQDELTADFKQPQMPTADKNGVYFTDAFDTRKESLHTIGMWNQSFKNVVNGQAVLSEEYQANNYIAGDSGYYLLSNYTVQSQVVLALNDPLKPATTTAGLIGRMNGTGTGYEFYISINEDGSMSSAVLFNRTSNKQLVSSTQVKYERGAEYTLTMAMIDSTIRCYVDGYLVLEATDASNQTGTAGIVTTGFEGYYDNFVVRKPTTAESKGASTIITNPGTGDHTVWMLVAILSLALLCAAYMCLRLFKRQKQ